MLKCNAYQLKWIAMLGMALHHALYPWQEVMPLWLMIPLYAVGGLAFPILGYFVVEGYKHTSDLKRYILRLVIFGTIAIPFYMLALGVFRFNIMFAIVVSLLVLALYDKLKSKVIFWGIFILLSIPMLMFFDWVFFGPLVVMLYHLIKNETTRRLVPGFVAALLWLTLSLFAFWGLSVINPLLYTEYAGYVIPQRDMIYSMMGNTKVVTSSLFFPLFCIAGAILIKNYNGERGKKTKWLFYVFYPVHLAVIAALALLTGFADLSVFGF